MACVNASQIEFSLKTPRGEFETLNAQFQENAGETSWARVSTADSIMDFSGDPDTGVGSASYTDKSTGDKTDIRVRFNPQQGPGKAIYGLHVTCVGSDEGSFTLDNGGGEPCDAGSVMISFGSVLKNEAFDFEAKNCHWSALEPGESLEICDFALDVTNLEDHLWVPEFSSYVTGLMIAPGIPVNLGGAQGKAVIVKVREPQLPGAPEGTGGAEGTGAPAEDEAEEEGPSSASAPNLYLTMTEKGFTPYPDFSDYSSNASYLDPLPNDLWNLMASALAGGSPFAWTSNAPIDALAWIKFFGNPYSNGAKLIADVGQWAATGNPLTPDPVGAVGLVAYNPEATTLIESDEA